MRGSPSALDRKWESHVYPIGISLRMVMMARSTVFTTNRSQAVRLPKPVALPASVRHVEITNLGRSRLVSPVGHSWDTFFDGPRCSDDFMAERRQPTVEKRRSL